ncbi:MAG: hypothetical protein Q4D60_02920, partial [Eubacteriales bacterium]|nr:hypothetical protein [Eubacteriales bacterium]
MAEYHRILSYLYRYDRKQKKDCKGFVKAEQKSDGIKMTVQIVDERLMENTKLLLCVYTREGESWKLIPIDTLTVSQGREEHIIICKKEQLAEKFEIRNQYGVLLFWQNSFSYPYAKVAMQKEVSSGETLKKEEKRKIGEEGILCETFPCYGSVWIGDEIPLESLMEKKIFPKNVEKEDKKEESDGEKSENVYDGIEKREDGEKKKEEEEKEIREKGEDKVAKKDEEERQRAAAQKGNEEKCGDSTEKRECEEGK